MGVIQINRQPTRRQLRHFGFVWLGFMAAFGAVALWRLEEAGAAAALWSLAGVVPVIGWVWPSFMRAVFVGMSYLAWPIGIVVSHVVLAVVYYLVLTPVGLALRVLRYDPLQRRFDADTDSYWVKRAEDAEGARRHFRQF